VSTIPLTWKGPRDRYGPGWSLLTWRSVATLSRVLAATVIGVLPVFLVGSLSVFMVQDLPLDAGRLGLIAAIFWAASAACSWPAGRLADRVGPAWAMGTGVALSATGAAGVATSRGLAPLAVSMAAGGAGNAIVVPGCNLAVARCLPVRRQGLAFGFKQAAVSSGVLLAGIAVASAAVLGGWREAFAGAAVLAVLCAGVMIRWQCIALQRGGDQPAAASFTLPRHGMLLLAMTAGMASATNTALTAFFVASAVDGGRDARVAGTLLSIGAALGITARLVLGRHADRSAGTGLGEMSLLLFLGAPGFALLAWPGSPPAMFFGTILAFGAGWGWTGLYHLAIIRLRPHAPAAATGAASTALFVGAVAGPWGFGALASATSYHLAWLTAGGWLVLAALGVHVATRLTTQQIQEEPV
jgi:predicted MFS family arabinose efflux permease